MVECIPAKRSVHRLFGSRRSRCFCSYLRACVKRWFNCILVIYHGRYSISSYRSNFSISFIHLFLFSLPWILGSVLTYNGETLICIKLPFPCIWSFNNCCFNWCCCICSRNWGDKVEIWLCELCRDGCSTCCRFGEGDFLCCVGDAYRR